MKTAIETTIAKLRPLLIVSERGTNDNNDNDNDNDNDISISSENDNAIKVKNHITSTNAADTECSLVYDELASMLTHTILRGRHSDLFQCLKTYRKSKKTGVFKVDNRFIIKYDSYADLRLLKTYKRLGAGINDQYKIVTPDWYSFIQRNNGAAIDIDTINDIESRSSDDECTHNGSADDNKKKKEEGRINTDTLMTLEIQPMLQDSIVFHEWYRRTQFNTQDHDNIITNMMLSVAKSIKYCHDLDLVHGDIKPDNLMVVCDARSRAIPIMRRTHRVPDIYLIDFGMCGRHKIDDGTGGTRPYCAPETNNVNNVQEVLTYNLKERTRQNNGIKVYAVSGDEYVWNKLTKAQDVWSLGLILFTLISYYNTYNYYREYPMRTFDRAGFVRNCELANNPDISDHALYPVLSKMLCPHDQLATIDEVISMMDDALVSM
jgi:hypothetical protein